MLVHGSCGIDVAATLDLLSRQSVVLGLGVELQIYFCSRKGYLVLRGSASTRAQRAAGDALRIARG